MPCNGCGSDRPACTWCGESAHPVELHLNGGTCAACTIMLEEGLESLELLEEDPDARPYLWDLET